MTLNGPAESALVVDADFTTPTSDVKKEAALELASSLARRYWLTRRGFRRAIESVNVRHEQYQRALYHFEQRTISLAMAAGGNRTNTQKIPDSSAVDPWRVDPATIEADTRVTAICPDCEGST